MIAVDASAILAIYLEEPDAALFRRRLASQGGVISPVNHWEVLARAYADAGETGVTAVEDLLESLGVEIAVISSQQSRAAATAFQRFGKRSAGRLNLGDCFAYALAEIEGDGLLFKGDDFPKTDVRSALA